MNTQKYTIREATPDDALQIIAHVKRIADEPNNGIGISSAAEFTMTEAQERDFLAKVGAAENQLYLVGVVEGEVIAAAHFRPPSGRIAYQHTVSLGISIDQNWRDQGLGTELMQRLIDSARENPMIKRLELDVYHINARAIHVYEKLGFQREGVRRSAVYKDGQFLDLIFMAIVFDREMGQ